MAGITGAVVVERRRRRSYRVTASRRPFGTRLQSGRLMVIKQKPRDLSVAGLRFSGRNSSGAMLGQFTG